MDLMESKSAESICEAPKCFSFKEPYGISCFILLVIHLLLSEFSVAGFTYTLNHKDGGKRWPGAGWQDLNSLYVIVEAICHCLSHHKCPVQGIHSEYNSLNKALDIIKSRGNLLGEIQFSGSSEKLIVDQTVHFSQIKNPLQIKPLEGVENSGKWPSLALDEVFRLWDHKMQGIETSAFDDWINFEISLCLWDLRRYCKDFTDK